MMESYKKFWQNIANFSDTSNRPDYWWPTIINYILGGILSGIFSGVTNSDGSAAHTFLFVTVNSVTSIIVAIVWIATLSLKVRRLHDTDRSGWWVLIDLIPIIGTIWFFILMILPTRSNRWS
ncbi:DUF805 domain-containing protein [Furfurilactobacillus siliginis]|uniref:Membrane protein n=1 Tax=Furfurilactobacillus siliginis TaxID=348151 RepID=A0A0R2L7L2_9LACO|nr:DUF805 domain-containing protein [Furfurilactobacillus siliginis]KRN94679.1 hypothetical protein IV55_GL000447 [Furfurilactobacillus siliginis]GEK28391.1 membrane protein [Furfurilactobacillus siliginis]